MTIKSYNFRFLLLLIVFANFQTSAKQKNSNKIPVYYKEDDGITILDVKSYKKAFYGQSNSWVIEYYKRPCEFCSDFAATWKNIAKELKFWRDMIQFAAIDCTSNSILMCKSLGKMDHPIIVYYHEYFTEKTNEEGQIITMDYDTRELKRLIIKHIIEEQNIGRGKIYPNIKPYLGNSIKGLFTGFVGNINLSKDILLVIFEHEKNSVSAELIMDFRNNPHIKIKYCYSNNKNLTDVFAIKKLPTVVIIKTNRSYQKFHDGIETKIKMKKLILSLWDRKMNTGAKKGVKKPEISLKIGQVPGQPPPEGVKRTINPIQEYLSSYKKQVIKNKIKDMHDPLFLMDLETALRLSFKNEIGAHALITGEKYHVLLNYTRVVMKYFPLTKRGRRFMLEFKDVIRRNKKKLSGAKIKYLFQKHRDVFRTEEDWMACDRDVSPYGKYHCGIWKLFHYFTVRAAEVNNAKSLYDVFEVLTTFHNYVRYFMSCEDCVQLFRVISEEEDMNRVNSFDSAIVWLWMVHNIVNDKLARDAKAHSLNNNEPDSEVVTKTIEFPKIQFPSPDKCPTCRNIDNTWNIDGVLYYMKRIYSNYSRKGKPYHFKVSKEIGEITVSELLNSSIGFGLFLLGAILIILTAQILLKCCYKISHMRNSNINNK